MGKSKENRGKWAQKAFALAGEFTDDFEGDEEKKAQRKALLAKANSVAGNIYGYEEEVESSDDDAPIIRPTKHKPSNNNNNSTSKPPAGKPSYLVAKPKPEGEEDGSEDEGKSEDDEVIKAEKKS